MHDVGGSLGELREAEHAMHCLALHDRGPREPVVHRSGLPLVQELAHQHVDRAAVLRVHHDERARLPGLAHGTEDRCVVQHEHAGVGHEELERRDALPDQLIHLLQDLVVDLADDHMEAVVGDGVLRLREPTIETLSQSLRRSPVMRSRRSSWCRRTRPRGCPSRSRPSRSCRRTAAPCGCARRRRRASRSARSHRSRGPR